MTADISALQRAQPAGRDGAALVAGGGHGGPATGKVSAPVWTIWQAWLSAPCCFRGSFGRRDPSCGARGMNPETLPIWWGPDGFSCRTQRIDLRTGGDWVFDMIGPDGTVYPNHHQYIEVRPEERLGYALLWGENGPKHADAWASFEDMDGATKVTLGMVFATSAEFEEAKGFGAVETGSPDARQTGGAS